MIACQPRPQAFMCYGVTEGGLEPRRIFPPSSSGDVTFDYAPRTTGDEADSLSERRFSLFPKLDRIFPLLSTRPHTVQLRKQLHSYLN